MASCGLRRFESSLSLNATALDDSSITNHDPTKIVSDLLPELARCGARKGPASMKRQFVFERECVHRNRGADGDTYGGMFFIKALQRLQSDDAVRVAGKDSPFYWVDAPRVNV